MADPVADAAKALADTNIAAVIVICDSAGQPSLLVAPESRWAVVNVAALGGPDKLRQRYVALMKQYRCARLYENDDDYVAFCQRPPGPVGQVERALLSQLPIEHHIAEYYLDLAHRYEDQSRWIKAEQAYLQALRIDPKAIDIRSDLARISAKRGRKRPDRP